MKIKINLLKAILLLFIAGITSILTWSYSQAYDIKKKHITEQNLPKRIARVRRKILLQKIKPIERPKIKLSNYKIEKFAQWNNWSNYWSNWSNWNNWSDWRDWSDWRNYY